MAQKKQQLRQPAPYDPEKAWAIVEKSQRRASNPKTAQAAFISHCRHIAKSWAKETQVESELDRCMGVVHSMLAMLDGVAMAMPSYAVRPIVDVDEGTEGDDIAGDLHHMLYAPERRENNKRKAKQ